MVLPANSVGEVFGFSVVAVARTQHLVSGLIGVTSRLNHLLSWCEPQQTLSSQGAGSSMGGFLIMGRAACFQSLGLSEHRPG